MKANQNTVLKALGASGDTALSLDAICAAVAPGVPCEPKTKLRKYVILAVGALISSGLASRSAINRPGFGGTVHVEYRCTADGLARVKEGKPLKSGKTGPRSNLPHIRGEMRQRIWEALRLAEKSTIPALVELIHREGDADAVKVIKNTQQYFARLESAGIVARLSVREKGCAPTSNGITRFALVRDLGAIAPSAGARFVTDHNAQTRIDYRKEQS